MNPRRTTSDLRPAAGGPPCADDEKAQPLETLRRTYYETMFPLEAALATTGSTLIGQSTSRRFATGTQLSGGENFEPIYYHSFAPHELRDLFMHTNYNRLDWSREYGRPLVFDFEISESTVYNGCACHRLDKRTMCETCFERLMDVTTKFMYIARNFFSATCTRFFTGGRGFHLYVRSGTEFTRDDVEAVLVEYRRRLRNVFNDEDAFSFLDLPVTLTLTHKLRLPFSVRDNGNIVCVARDGMKLSDALNIRNITREAVERDASDALADAKRPV